MKPPSKTKRIKVFLEELRRHGVVLRAAKAASPHCSGSGSGARTLYRWVEESRQGKDGGKLARQFDEALDEASAAIEAEIHRRATGFTEARYDGEGKVLDRRERFSDACLLALAKVRVPGFQDRKEVSATGQVAHAHVHLGEDFAAAIRAMPQEDRELLRLVLERQKARQNGERVPQITAAEPRIEVEIGEPRDAEEADDEPEQRTERTAC